MPHSRGSSRPRDQTCILQLLHWQMVSLPIAPLGKPTILIYLNKVISCVLIFMFCQFAQLLSRAQLFKTLWTIVQASQVALVVKNPLANAGGRDAGLIPGSGRSPGGGEGSPLQYSCLENSTHREAWQAPVHKIAQRWTRLKQLHMNTLPIKSVVDKGEKSVPTSSTTVKESCSVYQTFTEQLFPMNKVTGNTFQLPGLFQITYPEYHSFAF